MNKFMALSVFFLHLFSCAVVLIGACENRTNKVGLVGSRVCLHTACTLKGVLV